MLRRYFWIVLTGFSVDYLAFLYLVEHSLNFYLANVCAFLIGMSANVLLIRRFLSISPRFNFCLDLLFSSLTSGTVLGLGTLLLWILIEGASIPHYLAKLVANGITFGINYLIRKRLLSY